MVHGLLLGGWCAALLPERMLPGAVAYHMSLTANLLIGLLSYGSLAAIPLTLLIGLASFVFRRRIWARKARSWALPVLVPLTLTAPMRWIHPVVYWPLHHKAVRAVPSRAQGLVVAIEQYRQDHGAPPMKLDVLLPGYIKEIPATGLAGFPRFKYRVVPDNEAYQGRYELFMPCPYSYCGPSALLYWPKENGYLVSWPQDAAWRWDDGDWVYVNMK